MKIRKLLDRAYAIEATRFIMDELKTRGYSFGLLRDVTTLSTMSVAKNP